MSQIESSPKSRWYGGYAFIFLAFLIQSFRISTTVATNGETPFLSANDRSRWCTIAALIEDGSFVIDRFLTIQDSKGKTRPWYSIDMVRKLDPDGVERYYSSKPPLLSVMYAAVCSPLAVLLGVRLSDAPLLVGRSLVWIVNLLPLLVAWLFAKRWIETSVESQVYRWILLAFVVAGTFLTTFSNTLNNHLPAAVFTVGSMALFWIIASGSKSPWVAVGCGLFSGLTASAELPALAWFAVVGALVLYLRGWFCGAMFIAGAVPVAVAFAVTNYIAYGDLEPPYVHREKLGKVVATGPVTQLPVSQWIDKSESVANASDKAIDKAIDKASGNESRPSSEPSPKIVEAGKTDAGVVLEQSEVAPSLSDLEAIAGKHELPITAPFSVKKARRNATWEFAGLHAEREGVSIRYAVEKLGGNWVLHQWNDWYDYPKSYWLPGRMQGVDLGEPCRGVYAFHVLIGHHGVFSLTPFWLLIFVGVWRICRLGSYQQKVLMGMILAVSTICIAFYIARPLIDRNYGGVASGFRWLFWLAPAWIWLVGAVFAKLPGETKRPARLGLTIVAVILLAASIFSATVPWANPWQNPWLYTLTVPPASSK